MALRLPAHLIQSDSASPVRALGFSADGSTFASAETAGWRVWDTVTLQLLADSGADSSSYSLAAPLYRSNIILLVGGPPESRHAPNKLIFWDESAQQAAYELEFGEQIRGIASRYDRLVVALAQRVFVFAMGDGPDGVWQEAVYETAANPKGLIAVSSDLGSTLLAFPGRQSGHVQLVRLPPLSRSTPIAAKGRGRASHPAVSIIIAHTSSLSALCCSASGSLLATASTKGTLIRLWDVGSAQLVRELRRGTDTAEIFSLALRHDGGALAVGSDKGTVHVWQLDEPEKPKQPTSPEAHKRVSLSSFKPYLPKYFSSEWSQSQFRLPPPAVPTTRFSSVPDEAPTVSDDVCTCVWLPSKEGDAAQAKLHILTRSGGSFRLALEPRNGQEERAGSPAPQAWGATGHLRLEEYKRWGGEEGWD